MPQFQLDQGGQDSAKRFTALDAFTQSYIEAVFFTEATADTEIGANATLDDLSPEAWQTMIEQCDVFKKAAGQALIDDYGHTEAGHDFWFTRNGHGVGFWEGDHGKLETWRWLDILARTFVGVNLYRGDDGLIYTS